MPDEPKYKRILLKLSGEGLMGNQPFGIDSEEVARTAAEVKAVRDLGAQVGLVIGGGNIFRGLSDAAAGIERTTADYMGMMATVMNALAMSSALKAQGVPSSVMSGIAMPVVCDSYTRREAVARLEAGEVVVFAGGTGNPFFTTDTAAALRAAETGCDALIKGTQVDGVYDADPKKVPNAKRYERLTYQQVLADNLRVMDQTAVALARENHIPMLVCSVHEPGELARVVAGGGRFTIIEDPN
ncbi:UMP kinase [Magnetospira sp. QH-2]|uniref:UMP kinase n=1 Tax=Magnetospira sp. (strain QH-2) TaxID=1288970 RepID=UPI0003E81460|nr:UMP kinase [Magnetospira sp. QH-2]CCQ73986.1 Uridylate kinase (UK) (Uridine monophosphate kinase) (UMP kinase) [Magnetospira sp. QH-2]